MKLFSLPRWNSRRATVVFHDLFMIAIAWELAWFARFNFYIPTLDYWWVNLKTLPVVVAVQGLIAWRFGLYRGLWRFASLRDLWNIIRAATLGALCVTLVLFFDNRLIGVPRSVLVLYPFFLVFVLGGPRLAYRVWKDRSLNLQSIAAGKRVLIIGAGRAGEMLVRDMLREGEYRPVGFVDDQAKLINSRIHGVPVLGGVSDLAKLVEQHDVDILIIAVPSATSVEMQRIVRRCEQTGKPFQTLPRMQDMFSGRSALSALREVSIDDLLGREKVELDWEVIQHGVSGKSILVSGAGGSIGSELCHQIARLGPAALILFERSEFNLYKAEMGLRNAFPRLKLRAVLGDICDPIAVDHTLARYQPNMIFHAAAHKHVPILQSQAREAVRNNVLGTRTLANAAVAHRCEKFVLISTDKAVNPTSIMGASKRAAEILCEMMNRQGTTRFTTVRFGNVLGSAGSVVPLFQQQIKAGGPVTVTHRQMTRYFMTIPEACQLILQSGAMGQGGEIFVLDMGQPVKIAYLAEQMIRLSGKVPGQDIQIEYTGLRPGEKLYEELFYDDECLAETQHRKIRLARHRAADAESVEKLMAEFQAACERDDEQAIRELLHRIVPELHTQPASMAGKVVPIQGKV